MPAINLEKYVKEMKHLPISVIFMEAMQIAGNFEPYQDYQDHKEVIPKEEEEPIEIEIGGWENDEKNNIE